MTVQIPAYVPEIVLRHVAGSETRYPSKEKAFAELGYYWIQQHVGASFGAPRSIWGYSQPAQWILITEFGEPLTAADFEELHQRQRAKSFSFRFGPIPGYVKGGQVPGIGRQRTGHYFRRVRCHGALRTAEVFAEEGEVAPRAKRSQANIPDPYDDYAVAAREDRSWKRYRKHQWRERR